MDYKVPSIKEFEDALKDLLYDKYPSEGVSTCIVLTLYTKPQVDTIVNLVGGWDKLAMAIADKKILLSITYKDDGSLLHYIKANLQIFNDGIRVSTYSPIKDQT